MAEKTGIEWTDSTWNPTRGCSRISPGCTNCYAEKVASRFSGEGQPYHGFAKDGRWTGKVGLILEKLVEPLHWKKPRTVFVDSMSDLFHESLSDEQIEAVFGVMASVPHVTFQVLTKRADRMRYWVTRSTHERCVAELIQRVEIPAAGLDRVGAGWPWPLTNVWLGVSVENQHFTSRIDDLVNTPAAIRFLSVEPLLAPVELPRFIRLGRPVGSDLIRVDDFKFLSPGGPPVAAPAGVHRVHLNGNGARSVEVACGTCLGKGCPGNPYPCRNGKTFLGIKPGECTDLGLGVDWVIVGGESGPDARPMHPEWVRSIRDQCMRPRVAFFFKQWGEYAPVKLGSAPPRWGESVERVGKKAAGALLDGSEHREFPSPNRSEKAEGING